MQISTLNQSALHTDSLLECRMQCELFCDYIYGNFTLQAVEFVEKEKLFRISVAEAVNEALRSGDGSTRRKRQNVRFYMCILEQYYTHSHLCYILYMDRNCVCVCTHSVPVKGGAIIIHVCTTTLYMYISHLYICLAL